jgi:hypothetical protein
MKLSQRCRELFRTFGDAVLISALLAATLIPFAIKSRKFEQLYYGGKKGFVEDTVLSLINASLYNDSIPQQSLPTVIHWI